MGFVCDELVDGIPHIWQVAVHPGDDRQCLGRALVKAARQWARTEGFGAITLTTYRDVPRNGPFYGSLGFVTLDASLPGYRQSVSIERAIGEDAFGPRVAAARPLARANVPRLSCAGRRRSGTRCPSDAQRLRKGSMPHAQ